MRGLGIPVRFHDLRHYHASAVLEAGLPVPYIAKRLAHANAQRILTVYDHVLEGQGVGLADRLAAQHAAAQVRRIG